ncbi:MAG: hypothetical protein HY539_03230 [Deltaproteobacteria bacterium]|nr:hypothetical protein [Deltaproteobacteria bacterium]
MKLSLDLYRQAVTALRTITVDLPTSAHTLNIATAEVRDVLLRGGLDAEQAGAAAAVKILIPGQDPRQPVFGLLFSGIRPFYFLLTTRPIPGGLNHLTLANSVDLPLDLSPSLGVCLLSVDEAANKVVGRILQMGQALSSESVRTIAPLMDGMLDGWQFV